MAENNSTNAIRDAFNSGSVRDITSSLVNFAGEASNMAINSSLSPTGSVMDVMRRISEEGFCNFNKSMGYFMDRLMQINVNEKITTLLSLGQDAHLDGDATSITRNALNPTYARERNYLEFVDKVRSSETEGRFSTRRMTENGVYAETENLYPDELDRLEGTHKNNVWNAKDDMNSILYKTKRLFDGRKINTLISRFGTGADGVKTNLRYNGSARTKFGESHGRNLLKKAAEKGGTDYRYEVNGYSNPYCRVWTHHHQYDNYTKTIRPFENRSLSDIHNWGKQFDSDFSDNWIIAKGNGEFDSYKRTYGWKSGDNKGWELSVLDTSKGGDGLVKITPKYLGGLGKNIHTKECMFSIENLAWRDYDPYSFEKALSWEQRGPLGGRIMWFPPYGIQFNETTSVNWSSNTFIGRGEDVYTYVNTQRSGTLSFILLVDHPSVQDYATWHDGSTVSDTDLLRFYAGCDTMDPNDPDSILSSVKPTPLTDEYVEIKPEQDKEEKGKEDAEVEKDVSTPVAENKDNPPEGEGKIVFHVFFPNNYSGIYDTKGYGMDKNKGEEITVENRYSFPINYLLFGKGAQREGTGIVSGKLSFGDNLNFEYEDSLTKNDIGYEAFNTKGLNGNGIDYNNSIMLVSFNTKTEKGYYKPYDEIKKINSDKNGYRYYHRVDGSYQVISGSVNTALNNKFNEIIRYRNGELYKLSKPTKDNKNYQDLNSFKLNVSNENLPPEWIADSDTCKSTNLLSVAKVITTNEATKKLMSKYYPDDGDKDIITDEILNNIVSVSFFGYSNSHGTKKKNEVLAENRATVIREWLRNDTKLKGKNISFEDLKWKDSVQVDKGAEHDHDALSAKLYRSTRVEIKYRTAKVEPSSNSDVSNKKTEATGATVSTPSTESNTSDNTVRSVKTVNDFEYTTTSILVNESGSENKVPKDVITWKDYSGTELFYEEDGYGSVVYFPNTYTYNGVVLLFNATKAKYDSRNGTVYASVHTHFDNSSNIISKLVGENLEIVTTTQLLESGKIKSNTQQGQTSNRRNRSVSVLEGEYDKYSYYYFIDDNESNLCILCDKNRTPYCETGVGDERYNFVISGGFIYLKYNEDNCCTYNESFTWEFLTEKGYVSVKNGETKGQDTSIEIKKEKSEELTQIEKAQETIIKDNKKNSILSKTVDGYLFRYTKIYGIDTIVDNNNNYFLKYVDGQDNIDCVYHIDWDEQCVYVFQYFPANETGMPYAYKKGDNTVKKDFDLLRVEKFGNPDFLVSPSNKEVIETGNDNAYRNKSLTVESYYSNEFQSTFTYTKIGNYKVLVADDGAFRFTEDNGYFCYIPKEDWSCAYRYKITYNAETGAYEIGEKLDESFVELEFLKNCNIIKAGQVSKFNDGKIEYYYNRLQAIQKGQELSDEQYKHYISNSDGEIYFPNAFSTISAYQIIGEPSADVSAKDIYTGIEFNKQQLINAGLVKSISIGNENISCLVFDEKLILKGTFGGQEVNYIEKILYGMTYYIKVKKITGKFYDLDGNEYKSAWSFYNEPDATSNQIGGSAYAVVFNSQSKEENNGEDKNKEFIEAYLYKINDTCDDFTPTTVKYNSSYTGETINEHIRNCKNPNNGDIFIDRDGNVWTYDSNKNDWILTSIYEEEKGLIRHRKNENNTLRYDQEYYFFKNLERTNKFVYDKLVDKIKYFDPAFHSMTPEGFNARLTFLQQCTRQGNTRTASDRDSVVASNLAFGRPPYCVLRVGDFYNQMIVIDNMSVDYSVSDGITWDMNPEGVGMQPMLARVNISFKFIGGGDLAGPIRRLQNAMTFNYYANTRLYDNRADTVEYDWDDKLGGANGHYKIKKDSNGHYSVGNYAYTAQYYDDGKGKPLAMSTEQAKTQQNKVENGKSDRSKLNIEPMPKFDINLDTKDMFALKKPFEKSSLAEPTPNNNEAKQIQKTNPSNLTFNKNFNTK